MKKLILAQALLVLFSCNNNNSWKCEFGNCENGKGKRLWKDGGYENGIWKNGTLNGEGEQFFGKKSEFKGDTYKGGFLLNLYHGKGKYIDISMESDYVGEWQFGKPHGKGKLKFHENSKYPNRYYIGDWENGKRHGKGEKFWGIAGKYTNNKYIGDWKNNNQEGFGKYYWVDGGYFEGEWLNDEQHGKGKYVFPDGEVFEGIWINGYCKELAEKMGLE